MGGNVETQRTTLTSVATMEVRTRGWFFVLEGIDGSGKSTIARRAVERLKDSFDVVLTSEPSDSWVGDAVRRANGEDVSPFTEALLFVADRAEHTRQIASWLDEGKVVVCDRYVASTLAYQSVILAPELGGDSMEWLRTVNGAVTIEPDVTFLLDVDPERSLERVAERGERSKFERLGFLTEVRDAYRLIANDSSSTVVVDASRGVSEVLNEVLDAMHASIRSTGVR